MIWIYHLTTQESWDQALSQGEYRAASLESEGFIHASTIDQLEGSANRFFSGHPGLLLLKIEVAEIKPAMVWEKSSHSEAPFPHIYGPLNLNAVIEIIFWEKTREGVFVWPPTSTH